MKNIRMAYAGLNQTPLDRDNNLDNILGAMFHSHVITQNRTKVFQKGCNINVDSHSDFYDFSKRGDTDLELYLDKINVKKLYIAGLATDYCVKFTALDAVECGYRTFLLSNCCRAVNLKSGDEQDGINSMRDSGVVIMDSSLL